MYAAFEDCGIYDAHDVFDAKKDAKEWPKSLNFTILRKEIRVSDPLMSH
jgi:S-ribosylhomocysteine lyase LuxS involved in autoinducer biosynthesis